MNCERTSLNPKRIPGAAITVVVLVLAATATQASVVLSNLAETSTSSGDVTSSNIGGWAFTTGNSGFTVNGVTIVLGTATDTGSEFVLRIRSDDGGLPGSSTIMGLVGATTPSGVSGGSQFTYTPLTPSLVLSPNTTFWLTMGAKPGTGSYTVLTTSSDTFSTASGWSGSTSTWLSVDSATSWTGNTTDIPMVSFDVTAVPEPSSYATAAGIVLGAAAWIRRRSRG